MPAPTYVYTPVSPASGGEVHATTLRDSGKTVCGHKFRGWVIAPRKLTCKRCKELIHLPVNRDGR